MVVEGRVRVVEEGWGDLDDEGTGFASEVARSALGVEADAQERGGGCWEVDGGGRHVREGRSGGGMVVC